MRSRPNNNYKFMKRYEHLVPTKQIQNMKKIYEVWYKYTYNIYKPKDRQINNWLNMKR